MKERVGPSIKDEDIDLFTYQFGYPSNSLQHRHGLDASKRHPYLTVVYDPTGRPWYDFSLSDIGIDPHKQRNRIGELRLMDKLASYKLPMTLFSEIQMFNNTDIFQSLLYTAGDLFFRKPDKGDQNGRNVFRGEYLLKLAEIDELTVKKITTTFTSEDDPRIFTGDPGEMELYENRFLTDTLAQKLFEQYKSNGFPLTRQQFIKAFYGITDMSRVFLDMTLGDIGFMEHGFANMPRSYYAVLVYLDNFLLKFPKINQRFPDDMLGRIVWSIEQSESELPSLSPFQLSVAATVYSQLLNSIAESYFFRVVKNTNLEPFDSDLKSQWLTKLNKIYDGDIENVFHSQVLPYFFSYNEHGRSYILELIKDKNFGIWLDRQIAQSSMLRREERRKRKYLTIDDYCNATYEIDSAAEFRTVFPEMAYKSVLSIVLMSDLPYADQLTRYEVKAEQFYDCEIVDQLLQTIVQNDSKRLFDREKHDNSHDLVRFRLFINDDKFNDAVAALYEDQFPPLFTGGNTYNEEFHGFSGLTGTIEPVLPAVYLVEANGGHNITPVDNNQPEKMTDVGWRIKRAFDQGGFASLFVHLPAEVTDDRGNIVTINVELQLYPLSVQQQLHRQRRGWVNHRTNGERK